MWHHKVTARLARPAAVRSPLTRAAQVSVAPERPSPRETHPRRESNEESPESRRLFGAVWGAQPQRSPRGKTHKANAIAQRRTKAAPPAPFSVLRPPRPPATPSGSPQRNGQTRSEPTKADNRRAPRERTNGDLDPRGIETQDTASRPVWRKAANSRRDRTQNSACLRNDLIRLLLRLAAFPWCFLSALLEALALASVSGLGKCGLFPCARRAHGRRIRSFSAGLQ